LNIIRAVIDNQNIEIPIRPVYWFHIQCNSLLFFQNRCCW